MKKIRHRLKKIIKCFCLIFSLPVFDKAIFHYWKHLKGVRYFLKITESFKIKRCKLQPLDKDSGSFLVQSAKVETVYPVKIIGASPKSPIQVQTHNLYVNKIDNAIAIGRSLNVISKDLLYNELLSIAVEHPNHFVSDRGLLIIDDKVVSSGSNYWVLLYKEAPLNIENAISLLSHYSFNYYHFIFEILSKLYTLSFVDVDPNAKFLLSSNIRDCDSMHAFTNCFIPDSRIEWVNDWQVVKAKHLTFCSCPNIIPPNFHNINQCEYSDIYFDKQALKFLRNTVFDKLSINEKNETQHNTRFFILRRNYPNRNYNESELAAIAEERGYLLIDPSELSFESQVKLFFNASTIIGASGSAFANILFCRKSTKLLCIMSNNYKLPIFSTIAGMMELELQYVIGETMDKNNIQAGFYLNPNHFSQILEEFE